MIEAWLEQVARVERERRALRFGAERFTFGALARRAREVAAHLGEIGVGPGDRVALWLDSDPLFVAIVHAALARGASVGSGLA